MPENRDRASRVQITTAEPPSETGAHMGRVRGQAITRPASTSWTLKSFWNWARGFMVEWWWFLAETWAICSQVVPQVFMCRRALIE